MEEYSISVSSILSTRGHYLHYPTPPELSDIHSIHFWGGGGRYPQIGEIAAYLTPPQNPVSQARLAVGKCSSGGDVTGNHRPNNSELLGPLQNTHPWNGLYTEWYFQINSSVQGELDGKYAMLCARGRQSSDCLRSLPVKKSWQIKHSFRSPERVPRSTSVRLGFQLAFHKSPTKKGTPLWVSSSAAGVTVSTSCLARSKKSGSRQGVRCAFLEFPPSRCWHGLGYIPARPTSVMSWGLPSDCLLSLSLCLSPFPSSRSIFPPSVNRWTFCKSQRHYTAVGHSKSSSLCSESEQAPVAPSPASTRPRILSPELSWTRDTRAPISHTILYINLSWRS